MRGHKTICYIDEKGNHSEKYVDTGKEVEDYNKRPCIKCGKKPTPEGYDACIGELPGVAYACCGHGVQEGYILFKNGIKINGFFTVEKMKDDSIFFKEISKESNKIN